MKDQNKQIHKAPFDMDLFMETIGFFSVDPLQPGAYSNEDMQTYITPGIFSVKYWSYEEGHEVEYYVKAPLTLKDAINKFLPALFKESTWTNEEKQEIKMEYEMKLLGLQEREVVYCFPRIGLRKINKR